MWTHEVSPVHDRVESDAEMAGRHFCDSGGLGERGVRGELGYEGGGGEAAEGGEQGSLGCLGRSLIGGKMNCNLYLVPPLARTSSFLHWNFRHRWACSRRSPALSKLESSEGSMAVNFLVYCSISARSGRWTEVADSDTDPGSATGQRAHSHRQGLVCVASAQGQSSTNHRIVHRLSSSSSSCGAIVS